MAATSCFAGSLLTSIGTRSGHSYSMLHTEVTGTHPCAFLKHDPQQKAVGWKLEVAARAKSNSVMMPRGTLARKRREIAHMGNRVASFTLNSSFIGAAYSSATSSIQGSQLLPFGHMKTSTLINKVARRQGVSCRGSLSLAEAFRGGDRVESDRLPPTLRETTMKAVEALGGRVTVGDVAARAGIQVTEAEKALKALASDTGGFLEVSDEGDVLYVLPKNFRTNLRNKSWKLKLEPLWSKVKGAVEYSTRIVFGSALLASIALVSATIFVVLTSASSSKNDDRDRGSSGGGGYYYSRGPSFGPRLLFNVSDLFWYWDPYYNRNRRMRLQRREGLNFFESVFSFVFGDGDPNEGADELRWKTVGDFIAKKGGVVTGEELAPFLDPPPMDINSSRFDGVPEVDDQGNILYVFPQLQRTATDWLGRQKVKVDSSAPAGDHFQESQWKFTEATQGQQTLAIALGAFNFVGVVFVGSLLRDPQIVQQIGSGLVSFTASILPLLQGYAASFFAIPALRWWQLQRKNAVISSRNKARLERALVLTRADSSLKRKMMSAREKAQSTLIGSDRIIYSTDRDLSTQDVEGAEWERRLQEAEVQQKQKMYLDSDTTR
eukprot:jgi/Mesen1/10387/ME000081S09773